MPDVNGQAQQPSVQPEAVIDGLLGRIQQLVMELAMKDAYIVQLHQALAAVADERSSDGALVPTGDS